MLLGVEFTCYKKSMLGPVPLWTTVQDVGLG